LGNLILLVLVEVALINRNINSGNNPLQTLYLPIV